MKYDFKMRFSYEFLFKMFNHKIYNIPSEFRPSVVTTHNELIALKVSALYYNQK